VEGNLLVGQLAIHGSIRIGTSLHIGLITSIQVHLHNSASIDLATSALTSNFRGVYNILKNGILDSRESARTGAQSLGLLGTSITLSQNVALSDDDDMTSRELLLQLANETGLDLLEGFLEFEWDVYDDSLAARSAVNLLGGGDVQVAKGCLQLGGGHLEVEKFLGNLGLKFIGLLFIYEKEKRYRDQKVR
jgi:hypothetical protein